MIQKDANSSRNLDYIALIQNPQRTLEETLLPLALLRNKELAQDVSPKVSRQPLDFRLMRGHADSYSVQRQQSQSRGAGRVVEGTVGC